MRPITELPIHTYTPTQKGRMCVAYIGDLPIRFKAPTIEAVRAKADAWRHEEVAKNKAAAAKAADRLVSRGKQKETDDA
ncbi:hypothetical protein NBRC116590_03070 [Pelagimonas sp. KU-00592-HH]|uniref:hypothetical protein n=1 Tax=Pelagimonas sp. KU-00592-HH TaxID=3127651 RepID=UPI0031033EF2